MKLFLSSMSISLGQRQAFLELVGKKNPEEIQVALIENAADLDKGRKEWLYDNRASIKACGLRVDLVDLKDYPNDEGGLARRLEAADVVWLGGGNIYYLRWMLRETKADTIIQRLVAGGKVYGGGSAGAVVAGPTLKHFEPADNPQEAPEILYEGLGLTDIVPIPHWGRADYGRIMQGVDVQLQHDGYKVVRLTDEQALAIDGEGQQIVS